jgi:hypothetical protein
MKNVITMVWWEMENVPPSPYDLLECSHALLEHILVFHHKENLGLLSVQTPIQVFTYGCGRIIWSSLYCCHQIKHLLTTLLLHFIIV